MRTTRRSGSTAAAASRRAFCLRKSPAGEREREGADMEQEIEQKCRSQPAAAKRVTGDTPATAAGWHGTTVRASAGILS